MSHNLDHIDKRLEEQQAKLEKAEADNDSKALDRAKTEIKALTEIRTFYAGGKQ